MTREVGQQLLEAGCSRGEDGQDEEGGMEQMECIQPEVDMPPFETKTN